MEWLMETALQYPRRFIAAFLMLALVIGGLVWWQAVWQDPHKIFDDMLANNLAAGSVTKRATATGDKQAIDQIVRLQMEGTNTADWLVSATQNGAHVTTESIGTPTTGYLRYVAITNDAGQETNFAPILGQWSHSDGKTDAQLDQLFSQTLLDISNAPIPPIGNVSADKRENLLDFIRGEKVFTPDYSKLKEETVAAHSVVTYAVQVKLQPYVRLMQAFARDEGLKTLDGVDPTQYAGVPDTTFTMSVDRFSHQLVRVAYAPSGFVQTYSDWGLQTPIAIPTTTTTTTQLQHDLQSLGKS